MAVDIACRTALARRSISHPTIPIGLYKTAKIIKNGHSIFGLSIKCTFDSLMIIVVTEIIKPKRRPKKKKSFIHPNKILYII